MSRLPKSVRARLHWVMLRGGEEGLLLALAVQEDRAEDCVPVPTKEVLDRVKEALKQKNYPKWFAIG